MSPDTLFSEISPGVTSTFSNTEIQSRYPIRSRGCDFREDRGTGSQRVKDRPSILPFQMLYRFVDFLTGHILRIQRNRYYLSVREHFQYPYVLVQLWNAEFWESVKVKPFGGMLQDYGIRPARSYYFKAPRIGWVQNRSLPLYEHYVRPEVFPGTKYCGLKATRDEIVYH